MTATASLCVPTHSCRARLLARDCERRQVRHPNHWLASPEIAILPLAFGQVGVVVGFSLLNALLIAWRVRIEERVLTDRGVERRSA